jgi:hypothetical protein
LALRRLGQSACVKASTAALTAYFEPRGQFCTGTKAAAEKAVQQRVLRQQLNRKRTVFGADERNGFGAISRQAIAKGLARLPKNLRWLRRMFGRFYGGHVRVYFAMDENGDIRTEDMLQGIQQGDPGAMAYFAAGMDEAYMALRAEFPESALLAFADDVHGDSEGYMDVPPELQDPTASPEGRLVVKNTDNQMPVAVAVLLRWSQLARTKAGLEVRFDKCYAASLETALSQHEFGDIRTVDGLMIMGIPVGTPAYQQRMANRVVSENVLPTFDSIAAMPALQDQYLLNRFCAGACQVGHLQRSMPRNIMSQTEALCDEATVDAFRRVIGVGATGELSDRAIEQGTMPLRHGGFGMRLASRYGNHACLGGWIAAAIQGTAYHLSADTELVVADPDGFHNLHGDGCETSLPLMESVALAWRDVCEGDPHVRLWCQAIILGFLPLQEKGDDEKAEDSEAEYEKQWKLDTLRKGPEVAANGALIETQSAKQERELQEKVGAAMDNASSNPWLNLSAQEKDYVRTPERYVAALHAMVENAEWLQESSVQRFLSRSAERQLLTTHRDALPSEHERSRHISHVHSMTSVPWKVLPWSPRDTFANDEWKWACHARLGIAQPSIKGLPPRCTCAPRTDIAGGHHFLRCQVGGGPIATHDALRDVIRACCADAGLHAQIEAIGVLPGSDERPADILADNMVIDTTVVDAHPHGRSRSVKAWSERANIPGFEARAAEGRKRDYVSVGGGGARMEDRVKASGREFIPLAFDTSGTPGASFCKFF